VDDVDEGVHKLYEAILVVEIVLSLFHGDCPIAS